MTSQLRCGRDMLRRRASWILPWVVLSVGLFAQEATVPLLDPLELPDPCLLLSLQDAQTILRGTVGKRPLSSPGGMKACSYDSHDPASQGIITGVTVTEQPVFRNGRDVWQEHVDSFSSRPVVSGVGDDADRMQGGPLHIRKGRAYLTIGASGFDERVNLDREKQVAQRVLANLPAGLASGYTPPPAKPAPAPQTARQPGPETPAVINLDGSWDLTLAPGMVLHFPPRLPAYVGPPLPDACFLLAGAGVAEVGGPASTSGQTAFDRVGSQCVRNGFILEVDPIMRGDRDLWAEMKADVKLVSEPIAGIGDEAWLSDTLLLVRAKHVLLMLVAGGDQYTDARIRAQVLKTIGQKVVSQL